jgi:hypothetical protein
MDKLKDLKDKNRNSGNDLIKSYIFRGEYYYYYYYYFSYFPMVCEVMFLSLNVNRLLLEARKSLGCFTRPMNMLP